MRAVPTTPFSLSAIATRRQFPNIVAVGSMDSMGLNSNNIAATSPQHQRQDEKSASPSPISNSTTSAVKAIQFLTLCQRLKTTKRTGWVNHGLKNTESISDHMYRMALMALIVDDVPELDMDRCLKIAIVHDLAEAIVGDITPSDGVPKEEKSKMERDAMDTMVAMLGGGESAQKIKRLWEEYEGNATPEAKLVKDFDKLEMILQAQEYEEAQGKHLEDFFRTTKGQFQTDVVKGWAAEVVKRRPNIAELGDLV